MPNLNLIAQAREFADNAAESVDEYSGVLGTIQQTIVEYFGQTGLYATYIALAALVMLVVWRLTKVTFAALKYMAIPAVALAFIGSFFLPYSFVALLPATVAGCSLILLFKG
jgi:hypothetical protein